MATFELAPNNTSAQLQVLTFESATYVYQEFKREWILLCVGVFMVRD